MSSDVAIRIDRLGKAYRIHHREKQVTLAEQALQRLRHPFARVSDETFWALDDVSLEIKRGEVLGIIGRNGAGKSTLLKILSRITSPTTGQVEVYGRIGSLLEVGAGFHPELTGRENIFLNGAILGMRRSEVARQFDAIVEFAGVERFVDTPVKRYSSGMYVRLAFAVAAHLETEILLVDEVLAVGDQDFQDKCLGKMNDVAQDGRTVVLVSHNHEVLARLAKSAALFSAGRCVMTGSVEDCYHAYNDQQADVVERDQSLLPPSRVDYVRPRETSFRAGAPVTFDWEVTVAEGDRFFGRFMSFHVIDPRGFEVAFCDTRLSGTKLLEGTTRGTMVLRSPWLRPGKYRVTASLCYVGGLYDLFEDAANFRVVGPIPYPGVEPERSYEGGLLADFDIRVEGEL